MDALAHCARERFSRDSLDRLCDALEGGLKSSDDPWIELLEALTNYVYQLRDGAIQANADTTSLFHEARTLLGDDASSRPSVSFDDQVANLLERIDLAASGGFDALEAGEVSEFDRVVESTSESLRIQNALHRIHAALNAIERHTQLSRSDSPSLATLFSRHRQLLDSLAPPPFSNQAIPLAALEELLSLQLAETNTDLKVDSEAFVHPTYIPMLTSLITHLANTVSTRKIEDIQISRRQDEIEIRLTLRSGDSPLSDFHTTAIERGFLNSNAPIHDGDELQYLLLPRTSRANEQLTQSSALFDDLQSLCGNVSVESMEETITVTTTLPANVKLEEVTTFKLNGELYAILTESVKNVDYTANADEVETPSSPTSEPGSYRVISLNQSKRNDDACLQIDDGINRIAMFVDQMEPPGQLPVLDSFIKNAHIGGGVRLLDRRLAILLSPGEFDELLPSAFIPSPSATSRLLVLGAVPLVSQLSLHEYQVSYVEGELDAVAAFQEQRPKAIMVAQHEIATYDRLLTTDKVMNVAVIVFKSGNQELEIESPYSEFKTVNTLTELEAQLQGLVGKNDDDHP